MISINCRAASQNGFWILTPVHLNPWHSKGDCGVNYVFLSLSKNWKSLGLTTAIATLICSLRVCEDPTAMVIHVIK